MAMGKPSFWLLRTNFGKFGVIFLGMLLLYYIGLDAPIVG